MLRNSVQATHGFCSLWFSSLALMNWVLLGLQLQGLSIFSLQTSPSSPSAQPGADLASWDSQHSPSKSFIPRLAQAECSLCRSGVGWEWASLPTGAEPDSLVCFLPPAPSWRPSPCPTFRSQRWTLQPRVTRPQTPQVHVWWEEPPAWGQLLYED